MAKFSGERRNSAEKRKRKGGVMEATLSAAAEKDMKWKKHLKT